MNKKLIYELSPQLRLQALAGLASQIGITYEAERIAVELAYPGHNKSFYEGWFAAGADPADVTAPVHLDLLEDWMTGQNCYRACHQLADDVQDYPAPAEDPKPESPASRLDRLIDEAPDGPDLPVGPARILPKSAFRKIPPIDRCHRLSDLAVHVARNDQARVNLQAQLDEIRGQVSDLETRGASHGKLIKQAYVDLDRTQGGFFRRLLDLAERITNLENRFNSVAGL